MAATGASSSNDDSFRISDLQEQIYSLRQGVSSSLGEYCSRLKTLWNELRRFRPLPVCYCNPKCSCGALAMIKKHQEDDLVICLLKGLNENYSSVRFQIMLIYPLPNIGKVMEILQNHERQLLQEGTLSTQSPSNNPQENQRRSDPSGKRPMCTYCGLAGHTIERCYKKHGYPPRVNQSKKGERTHYDHLDTQISSEGGSFQGLTQEQYQKSFSLVEDCSITPSLCFSWCNVSLSSHSPR